MNIDLLLAAARHIEQQSSIFKTDSDRREEDTESGTLVNSVTSAHIHRHHVQQQQPPQSEPPDPAGHPDRIATLDGLSGPAASGSSSPDDGQDRRIRPSAGMREVHNKLEKNRRAHLKECFDYLRDQVPALQDRRSSNLGILRGALRCIASLKRREQHLELQMERLAGQKIANQQRLGQLRRDAGARWDRVSPAASSVASPDDRPQHGPASVASPDALTTNSGNNGDRGGSPRCRRRRLSGTSSTVGPQEGEDNSEPSSCKRLRTDANGSPAHSPASVAAGDTVSAATPAAATAVSTTQLMLCSTAAGASRPITVVSTAPPPVLLRPAVPQLQQHSRLLVAAQGAVHHSPPGLGGLVPVKSFPGDNRRPPLLTRAERTSLSSTTASRTLLLDTLPARLLPGQLVAPSIPVVAGTGSGGGKVQLLAQTSVGLVPAAAVSGARGFVTTPAISGPSVFSRVSRALLAVPASRQLAAPSIASASRTLITLSPAPQPSPGRATTYLTVHQQPRASSSTGETAGRTGRNTSAVVVIPTVPTSAAAATVTRLHVPGGVTRLVASPLPRLVAQQPSTQLVVAAAPSTHSTPAAATGPVLSQRGDKVMKQITSSKRQVVKRVTSYFSSGSSQSTPDNGTAARVVVSTPTISPST